MSAPLCVGAAATAPAAGAAAGPPGATAGPGIGGRPAGPACASAAAVETARAAATSAAVTRDFTGRLLGFKSPDYPYSPMNASRTEPGAGRERSRARCLQPQ